MGAWGMSAPRSMTMAGGALRCALLMVAGLLAGPAWAEGTAAPYTGPKKTVFVSTFDSANMLYGQATGEGLSQMLLEAIMNDGRFVAVERLGFADIEAEQQL